MMDMKFWSTHERLRIIFIALFFICGIVAIFFGTKLSGELSGMFIMLAGLVLLLVALWIYNKPFTDPPQNKL